MTENVAMPDLSHIDTWIFDLDNTLYHPSANLFTQIDARMGAYIQGRLQLEPEAARALQKQYFYEYGTTLRGLMAHDNVDPIEFLDFVHDIDLGHLEPQSALGQALEALPGRKLVFTNGDTPYARRVLKGLGLSEQFEAVHCIISTGFIPKPQAAAYTSLVNTLEINPHRALFVEDMARNLNPAKKIGMTTVWVDNGSEWGNRDAEAGHIDLRIEAVEPWLSQLVSANESRI